MQLELVHRPAVGPERPVKLLFIHGICTGAWVWEHRFLPFFSHLGYSCHALSLRGHGRSDGRDRIRQFTLGDFARDVDWAVKEIGAPLVLIGHSLGGGVVQTYIANGGKAAGVVLLCAAPPHGLLRASMELLTQNPALANELQVALNFGLRAANLETIENGLFVEPPPEDIRIQLFHRMDEVAETASRQLFGWTPFAPLPWAMPKLLVIGGECDHFVPATDVRLTAIYYGERSHIVRDGAHAIMLDRNWHEAADRIARWLEATYRSGAER